MTDAIVSPSLFTGETTQDPATWPRRFTNRYTYNHLYEKSDMGTD